MVQRTSFVAVLYLLDVAAWVIMLGGVAAWQYQCNKDTPEGTIWDTCLSAQVQLNWWALFFQLFVLVFLFVVYFSRQGNSYKVSLIVMLAMVTTLMFSTTNNAFNSIKNSSGNLKSATQANAAGSIISMICNMLIIIIAGGDLQDTLGTRSAPAAPMSHQGTEPAVQMSSSTFNPAYGTKPPV